MGQPAQMHPTTPEEWLVWEEKQPERYEYLGLEPQLMAGATVRHNDIAVNLVGLLRERLRGTPCRANVGDVKVGLTDGRWTYPDLLVRCSPRGPETIVDDPVVIAEVLSPSTHTYDTQEKRWAYQEVASLRHLVLVAQDRAKVEVATRGEDGTWRSVFYVGTEARFRLDTPTVELSLAEIYEGIDFSSAASAQSEAASEASTTPAKA